MTATVVVCTWPGVGEDADELGSALTLARALGEQLGAESRWLVLGDAPEGCRSTAGAFGISGIDHIAGDGLGDESPDAVVEAVARYWADRDVQVLVVPQSFGARVVAPRIAQRCEAGVVMNALEVEPAGDALEVTASAYGGDTRVVYRVERPGRCVLGLLPNALEAQRSDGTSGEPPLEEVTLDLTGVSERVRVVEHAHSEGPRLEEAEVIVAGGRGLGAVENLQLVERLAEALGGMTGVSRPLVDDGWTDSSHQVGLTGKYTRPSLYIAAGISGATQHMVGCAAAKTIVAINTDPDAAIFQHARFGVVGDCTEVLPELLRAVEEAEVAR